MLSRTQLYRLLGAARGPAEVQAATQQTNLAPILVDGLGRSGTTRLMQLLSSHPQVVADRQYPLETRYAVWVLHSLDVLAQPQRDRSVEHQWTFLHDDERAEKNPFFQESKAMKRYGADRARQMFHACARQIIDDFYLALAREQGKPQPTHFCEKFPGRATQKFRDAYAACGRVFILRDPRDIFISSVKFNERRGRSEFGAQKCNTNRDFLNHIVSLSYKEYMAARKSMDTCIVRYDDMVADQFRVAEQVFSFFGLPFGDAEMTRLKKNLARTDTNRTHITSESSSIGRFFREADAETIDFANENLSAKLREMGFA